MDLLDLKIFVELDDDVRLARRSMLRVLEAKLIFLYKIFGDFGKDN